MIPFFSFDNDSSLFNLKNETKFSFFQMTFFQMKYNPYKEFFGDMDKIVDSQSHNKKTSIRFPKEYASSNTFLHDVYMNIELPSMKTINNTMDDHLNIEWTKHIGVKDVHCINLEWTNYNLILKRNSFYAFLLVLERLNIFLPNELKEIIFENMDVTLSSLK